MRLLDVQEWTRADKFGILQFGKNLEGLKLMSVELLDDPFGDSSSLLEVEEQKPSTVKPSRVSKPVIDGKPIVIGPPNPLPAWGDTDVQDSGDLQGEVDYQDLDSVNRDLTRLRIRLHRVRRGMRAAAREAVEAKLVYNRALRRALVQQTGGSAEMRKASAELLCEDLEADMVIKQQVVEEYSSLFRAIRDDIENAKTIAFNLRSLMNIV